MLHRIMVFGDSILKGIVLDEASQRYQVLKHEGCVPLVEKKLGIPIESHCHFGMTSERGKLMLARAAARAGEEGQAALIEFGGNDVDYDWPCIAKAPDQAHTPHTPPEQFEQNMAQMVCLARQAKLRPVLMTLPPIDAKRYFAWFSRSIPNAENILAWLGDVEEIYRSHFRYNQIIRRLAERLSCPLVDVRAAFEAQGDVSAYLCLDGIHPNRQGHRLMGKVFTNYAKPSIMG